MTSKGGRGKLVAKCGGGLDPDISSHAKARDQFN